jgi:hypothetical protein
MWVPELKNVTILSEAWVFKNDCHYKMKDPGEDQALRSALDYMADRHPELYRHAQRAVHPVFVTLTKSQQKRHCEAAWRKLDGIESAPSLPYPRKIERQVSGVARQARRLAGSTEAVDYCG